MNIILHKTFYLPFNIEINQHIIIKANYKIILFYQFTSLSKAKKFMILYKQNKLHKPIFTHFLIISIGITKDSN